MKVKVCGLTKAEDIAGLSALPVDYLGFIFYEKSKRCVRKIPESRTEISAKRVGVFVNEKPERVKEIAASQKLDLLQIHGDESPDYCKKLSENGLSVVKAFRIDAGFDFAFCDEYEKYCEFFVFDASGKNYGGNGKKFNWDLLGKYRGNLPFLLSGGIRPSDAEEIRNFHHPKMFGIDLNSGFEESAGIKNTRKISKFLQEIEL